MDISSYATRDKMQHVSELKSTHRSGTGPLIWIRQNLPGVGFAITKLATHVIRACAESGNA